MLKTRDRNVRHGYEEELTVTLGCYQLEEIVAEKMRSLLQTQQKLIQRGWNQARAAITTISGGFSDSFRTNSTETYWTNCCAKSVKSEAFHSVSWMISSRKNWYLGPKNIGRQP